MAQEAKVLKLSPLTVERTLNPELIDKVQGNGRELAVAKFRELADKLESGELDGARIQWRDDFGSDTEMVTVTLDRASGIVQLTTTTIEEV